MRVAREGWKGAVVGVALLGSASVAGAEFVPAEDFESLMPGPIHGQNGWTAGDASSAVVVDPVGGGNQVLEVVTESTYLRKAMWLPDEEARMVFLRFRYASQLNISFGMSGYNYPYQFGDFEVELRLTNISSQLRINDHGSYADLTPVAPDTWYNCWLWVNNETEKTEVFLHARGYQPATAADRLDADGQTAFFFRSGGAGDLRTFFIKTGGGSGLVGPFYLDDIHVEETNALNLANPAGQSPAAAGGERAPALGLAVSYSPQRPSAGATIRLTAPHAADGEVSILDFQGRRVACVFAGSLAAGRHEMIWSGRDAAGREAVAGVYLCRARVGAETAAARILLVH